MVTTVVSTMSDTQRDAAVWQTLARIPDPEIPVLSIVDLGIVRGVEWQADELVVTVTPTYSGCPATGVLCQASSGDPALTGMDDRLDRG